MTTKPVQIDDKTRAAATWYGVVMLAERLLHHVGFHGSGFSAAQAHEWARGLLDCMRRRFCATRGHDLILQFEPGRVSLRCVDCGWRSAGWMIDRPRFS